MALGLSACGKSEPTAPAGESAYEIAVRHGFVGTEAEWLASLKGGKGDKGDALDAMPDLMIGQNGNWYINGADTGIKAQGERGADGDSATLKGDNGKSAYDVWCDVFGHSLTEEQWLEQYVKGKTEWTNYDLKLQMLIMMLTYQIQSTYTLDVNMTIPENITLTIDTGKTLAIPTGITLTVKGTLINYAGGTISVAAGGKIVVANGGLFSSAKGVTLSGTVEVGSGGYYFNNASDIIQNVTADGAKFVFNRGATYIENTSVLADASMPTTLSALPVAGANVKYHLSNDLNTVSDGMVAPYAILSAHATLEITRQTKLPSSVLVWNYVTFGGETINFGAKTSTERVKVTGNGTMEMIEYTMNSGAELEVAAGATLRITSKLDVKSGAELTMNSLNVMTGAPAAVLEIADTAIFINNGTVSGAVVLGGELNIASWTASGQMDILVNTTTTAINGMSVQMRNGARLNIGTFTIAGGAELKIGSGVGIYVRTGLTISAGARVDISGQLVRANASSYTNSGTITNGEVVHEAGA